MTSLRTLTGDEADRVRERLRIVVEQRFDGNQSHAARALSISQQLISKTLIGHAPGLYLARQLAAYLRIPLAEMLTGEELMFPLPPSERSATLAQAVARFPGRWTVADVAAVERSRWPKSGPPDGWEAELERVRRRRG